MPHPTTDSRSTAGYLDTMLTFSGCSSIPVDQCHTGPGGSLDREAFAATSHIVNTPVADSHALLTQVHAAQGSGLKEAGISIDALGGAVHDVGGGDTAFGHRGALATVQYTATYASGPATRCHVVRAWLPLRDDGCLGHRRLRQLRGLLVDELPADYFASNASRLAQVRAAYDPHGFFTQPQDF